MKNAMLTFLVVALIGVATTFAQPAPADPAKIIEQLGGSFRTDDKLSNKPIVEVDLSRTKANDKGLSWLKQLTALQKLDLRQTGIIEAGAATLREVLPSVVIQR